MTYRDYDDHDYDRDDDYDRPARRKVYRCGGWASYTGPCGASDCEDCHPGGSSDEDEFTDSALGQRLSAAGYEFNGVWERKVSTRTHTARRDHKDGKVKAGQRYTVIRYRQVDEDGRSRHHHVKRLVAVR